MPDKTRIKFSETVVLIDAAFLNLVIMDMKGYFEKVLQRSLQEIDLSMLSIYMTLDAGIAEEKDEVQFLFVYDKDSCKLQRCHPSDLRNELNGVAFQTACREYLLASISTEEMVSRKDLFLDLLSIISDSADVKTIIVVSFNEEYGHEVATALNGIKGKKVIQLRMTEPEIPIVYKWDILAFPLMRAMGISADEL